MIPKLLLDFDKIEKVLQLIPMDRFQLLLQNNKIKLRKTKSFSH